MVRTNYKVKFPESNEDFNRFKSNLIQALIEGRTDTFRQMLQTSPRTATFRSSSKLALKLTFVPETQENGYKYYKPSITDFAYVRNGEKRPEENKALT